MRAHLCAETDARPDAVCSTRRDGALGRLVLALTLLYGLADCGHRDALTDDGEPQRFRIDSVVPDPRDRDGDVSLYGVSVFVPASKTWRPYCAPDPDGRSAAIPVQGAWSAQGDPEPANERITFACTSGAIGKCIRFGYKPWKTQGGVSLRPYH